MRNCARWTTPPFSAPNFTDCVNIQPGFAYNHGGYQPEITTLWLGLVGPGVKAGNIVTANQTEVLSIAQVQPIYVTFSVPENRLAESPVFR